MQNNDPAQLWENTRNTVQRIREQTARVIVGQDDVVLPQVKMTPEREKVGDTLPHDC